MGWGEGWDDQVDIGSAQTITGAKRSTQLVVLDKLPGASSVSTPSDVSTGKIWDWGGMVYNTKAGGALVDGAADDAATIQLGGAIAGTVVTPSGTSIIGTGLIWGNPTRSFRGVSKDSSILKLKNGANTYLFYNNGISQTEFADFTLDGNKANQTGGDTRGLIVGGAKTIIRNLRIINTYKVALDATAGFTDGLIQNIEIEGSGQSVLTGDSIQLFGSRMRVIGSRIDSSNNNSILFTGVGSDMAVVLGNTIHNSYAIGIAGGGGFNTGLVIAANAVDGTVQNHSIDIGNAPDTIVAANVIRNAFGVFSSDSGMRQLWIGNIARSITGTGGGGYGWAWVGNGAPLQYYNNHTYLAVGNLLTNLAQSGFGIDGPRGEIVIATNIIQNAGMGTAGHSAMLLNNSNGTMGNLLIIGNKFYDDQNVKTSTYGIDINNAAIYHIFAIHNDLRGNKTGAIHDLGVANYTHGNLGYNPRGFLTAPAPAASGVILYNPFNCDCVVYINGSSAAALTAIAIGGIAAPVNRTHLAQTTGGTLATATYWYRVSALNPQGETLASAETSIAVVGPTGSVLVQWTAVPGATGYNVYGRTTGAELKMVSNVQATMWLDDGSVTPSGALPGGDTTGNTAITGIAAAPANDSVITLHVPWGNGIKVTYTTFATANWQWQNAA